MDQPLVLQQRDERGVVTLTLNRPHSLNALSEAMLAALGEAFVALAEDESARAVVLGASGRAFCAGHDLKEMRAEPSLEYYERLFAQCSTVMLAIQRLPVPVIARVHGLATVPGFQRAPCHASGEEHSWRQAVHRHAVAAPFAAIPRDRLATPALEA
jgi:enoyl-CoA hydratase/carnithine racemase